MEDMTQALEDLLVCESLSRGDRDCVERALDEGYAALDETGKSRIRRLLNQHSARAAGSALQRYRQRRLSAVVTIAPAGRRVRQGARAAASSRVH